MRSQLVVVTLVGLIVTSGATTGARAAEITTDLPYLYQGFGLGAEAMKAVVELETAVGARETKPFGEHGFEERVNIRFSPLDWLTVGGWAGMLLDEDRMGTMATSLEASFHLLQQESMWLDLSLSAGYQYDYQEVSVPFARLVARKTFGSLDVVANGLVELPLAEGRDTVDFIAGLGGTYAVTSWYKQGVEVVFQDIEGFWDDEEAEGGARLLAGPTAWFALGEGFDLRLNAAVVVKATSNTPSRVAAGVKDYASPGFLGRLVVGYSF